MARDRVAATPAVPVPPVLKPFLRFVKLPDAALPAARRALDDDDDFRAEVAGRVSEHEVGRAGWLFLVRPEGWDAELQDLREEAEAAEAEEADRRADSDARRRLGAVEAELDRARKAAAAAGQRSARLTADLADAQRAQREAERELAGARASATGATAEWDAAAARAAAAMEERDRLAAEVVALRAEVERREVMAFPDRAAAREEAGEAIRAAAAAVRELAGSLDVRASELAARPGPGAGSAPAPRRDPAGRQERQARQRGRSPAPLPPGILEDSVEAARHLVRVPSMTLLVDGYNVSLSAWPSLPVADQRRRLVDALAELAARAGIRIRVVFDGAETVGATPVPSSPRTVRVEFSPPGVEADDVLLDIVARLPAGRPVLVASSDRRVRDSASGAGANVISSDQLLAVLGRDPRSGGRDA